MRVSLASLRGMGDFVPGRYSVPQVPVGMGDFAPGRFTVPQVPVGMSGLGDCAPGRFTVPQVPVGMSGLITNSPLYPIPQNSVIQGFNQGGVSYSGGISGLGCGGTSSCSGGCSCGGKCGGLSGTGVLSSDWSNFIGDLTTGEIANAFSVDLPAMLGDPIVAGIPLWAAVVGVPLILYLAGTKKRWR